MIRKLINMVLGIVVGFFYPIVFGKKPGPHAEKFFKNFTFVLFSLVAAKVFSVLFQVYIGATLGPTDYGKFAMISSVFHFLYVPMLLSIGTIAIKYLSGEKNEEEKQKIISTSFILTGISTVLFSVLFFAISGPLALLTSLKVEYVFAAIILAVSYVAFLMPQKIYQSFNSMKKLGIVNIINSFIFLFSAYALFMFFGGAIVPIAATFLGYIIPVFFIAPEMKTYFRPHIDRRWARIFLSQGPVLLLGTFCFAINENINKIFINIFLSLADVGFFQAYYYSTITVSSFFVSAFVMVFFPEASRTEDKKLLFGQIRKTFRFIPVVFAGLFSISFVILSLYGSSYPLILPLLFLFIITSIANFIFFVYGYLASSLGMSGIKLNTYSVVLVSAISVTMSYILIPLYGNYGAILSSMMAYFVGLAFIYMRLKSLVERYK